MTNIKPTYVEKIYFELPFTLLNYAQENSYNNLINSLNAVKQDQFIWYTDNIGEHLIRCNENTEVIFVDTTEKSGGEHVSGIMLANDGNYYNFRTFHKTPKSNVIICGDRKMTYITEDIIFSHYTFYRFVFKNIIFTGKVYFHNCTFDTCTFDNVCKVDSDGTFGLVIFGSNNLIKCNIKNGMKLL